MSHILIVDGNNLGMRAIGIAPLSYQDQRTEVIAIGINMLRMYLEQFSPDEVYICYDGGRDKYRTSLYPDYKKKKRELTDVEKAEREIFFDQMRRLQECVLALGIPQYRLRGREADDLIFSLTKKAIPSGHEVSIISTDEDMFQLLLLSEKVSVYSPIKKKLINRDMIEIMFGIKYENFVYYKSLVGDSSDNLPGVKGIGPKTAPRIIDILFNGMEPSEKDMRLLEKVDAELELMVKLVTFLDIPETEMEAGRTDLKKALEREPSMDDIYTGVLSFSQQYGMAHVSDNLGNFITPFESLWKRRRSFVNDTFWL